MEAGLIIKEILAKAAGQRRREGRRQGLQSERRPGNGNGDGTATGRPAPPPHRRQSPDSPLPNNASGFTGSDFLATDIQPKQFPSAP